MAQDSSAPAMERMQPEILSLAMRIDWSGKRHQAVSGYWHSLGTLARWCRLRSYLDSAAHGISTLDAIRVVEGKPWLPPLPAIS